MHLAYIFKWLRRATFVLAMVSLFGGYAQAQSSNNKPAEAFAPLRIPSPDYPGVSWPFASSTSAATVPTIDRTSTLYLPYLPWIGDNVALLVNYANFFYQQAKGQVSGDAAYNSEGTALANQALFDARTETQKNANAATEAGIQATLSPNGTVGIQVRTRLVKLPGTDLAGNCGNNDLLCDKQGQGKYKDDAFNADTILGTTGYPDDSDMDNTVFGLVTFLTNGFEPLPPLPGKPDLSNLDVQKYVLQTRALAAAQSLAASNFNYLAQERKIVPGLGKKAGVTTLPTDGDAKVVDNVSQLQLEQFLVNRRLGNQSWYTSVNTAPSIAVQRETLFVLAEMNEQLFQLRLLNERLLATLSTMETQMTTFNKTNLLVLQEAISNKDKARDDNDHVPPPPPNNE